MTTQSGYQKVLDQFSKLRETVTKQYAAQIAANPRLAELLSSAIDSMIAKVTPALEGTPPPDSGLAQLIGLGPDSAADLGDVRIPIAVQSYDEQISSERIVAMGDLYYIYQHEKIGV